MYRTKAAVAVTLAGVLLAGCSSDGDGGSDTGRDGKGSGTKAPTLADVTVPSGYDGAKGWDQEVDWVPESTESQMPVATDGETVTYILRSDEGYTVQARDAATGKVRWTSAPYQVPTVITDKPSYGYDEDNAEIPQVTVVRQDGRTYVAAWAHGRQEEDALTKSNEVVQVDLYAMDSSGASVAPLHRATVPVTANQGTVQVRTGGSEAGLLVAWEDNPSMLAASVDAATGKVTQYDDADRIPDCTLMCGSQPVVAVTPKGPVSQGSLDGFGLEAGWSSRDIAPKGADPGLADSPKGHIAAVREGVFIAGWNAADSDTPVWSVHDLDTGRLLGSTACGEKPAFTVADGVSSPDGRYVAHNSVVFDTESGAGLCLQGDGTRRTIGVRALTDDGIAYGETDAESGATPVIELKVSDGTPKALPEGTQLPAAVLKEAALFTLRENGAGLRISVRLHA
ncbi:hypothetical protein [Streptomyces deccanensis]|uniref:hypothetical protein n=1 Tax=Streptomyces deccanensis TaxID=424188 RepID=UPI001EFBB4D6|nr:hypothetical protein [Streptomyces deccanensis]ULR52752.1 hypothetical protein L3078_27690 [Streptomyces deccanensis]